MPTLHSNGLLGNKPNWYRETPSRSLSKEVWINQYLLISPDSFEDGDAYSLHITLNAAKKFKSPHSWYMKSSRPEVGYVSHSTLERILKNKKQVIFETSD